MSQWVLEPNPHTKQPNQTFRKIKSTPETMTLASVGGALIRDHSHITR
jgi:hypothetical protein